MNTHIFIDANIFLSFYHLSSEDIGELEKLAVLVEHKNVVLLLPEQVVDEVRRNRLNKIKDAFDPFRKSKLKLSFPAYCKSYDQYDAIQDLIWEAEKIHKDLVVRIEHDIAEQELPADKLIDRLFDAGQTLRRTSQIIDRARTRMEIGNPPGKKGSLGDAINWECLLEEAPSGVVLHFIADDVDYTSPLSSDSMNAFLIEEWKKLKAQQINFYRRLSTFLRKNFPKINVKTEDEKDELIAKLLYSPNFAATHSLVERLTGYEDFTPKQLEVIMNALLTNSQVRWIVGDLDIFEFYKKLSDRYPKALGENHGKLLEILAQREIDEPDEEIPF